MTYDQPHDDSEQMMRMHYGDDGNSAAYDAATERMAQEQVSARHLRRDDVPAPGAASCSNCGGPLLSEREEDDA